MTSALMLGLMVQGSPSSVKADEIARILKDGYDVKLMNDGFRSLIKALALDYLFIDTHPGLSK